VWGCCLRCLGGVPYPSLLATLLLYAGLALFCGCGHRRSPAPSPSCRTTLRSSRSPMDTLDIFHHVSRSWSRAGVELEDFFTSGAIRDLYGDFKITTCGRCVSAWDACRLQKYEDIKSKEEQELHDIHSTRSKERLNAYT
ncbi:hypothetical protein CRUP_034874, partial [Coryphaenoides rupestris]